MGEVARHTARERHHDEPGTRAPDQVPLAHGSDERLQSGLGGGYTAQHRPGEPDSSRQRNKPTDRSDGNLALAVLASVRPLDAAVPTGMTVWSTGSRTQPRAWRTSRGWHSRRPSAPSNTRPTACNSSMTLERVPASQPRGTPGWGGLISVVVRTSSPVSHRPRGKASPPSGGNLIRSRKVS